MSDVIRIEGHGVAGKTSDGHGYVEPDLGWIEVGDKTRYIITAGTIEGLTLSGDASVEISGGKIERLEGYGKSVVRIEGGTISTELKVCNDCQVIVTGGSIHYLISWDDSGVTINGIDFAINGEPIDYGKITGAFGYVTSARFPMKLTGTLQKGDKIDCNIFVTGNSSILLVESEDNFVETTEEIVDDRSFCPGCGDYGNCNNTCSDD